VPGIAIDTAITRPTRERETDDHPQARSAARQSRAALSIASAPAFAAKPLFVGGQAPAPQRAALATAQQLSKAGPTRSLRIERADASVVSAQNREIELRLGSRLVNAVLDNAHQTERGNTVWLGRLRDSRGASALRGAREVRVDERNSRAT
jgi:hypothetical protein